MLLDQRADGLCDAGWHGDSFGETASTADILLIRKYLSTTGLSVMRETDGCPIYRLRAVSLTQRSSRPLKKSLASGLVL
jgi:hypothetical protein